ncbi:MAG: CCA tRNA nucleotidyltransferase [Rhodobacter sp.]|nr:CCA tRNA nucleotidyltransferase [Rhodobacter sp.]
MTRLDEPWIARPETVAVIKAIGSEGHPVLFVGGCVRNALLGIGAADIDLSTSARPETVMALAETHGLKAIPTGIEHGTVTVVSGGLPFEVTTFRRDIETFGRRAVIAFTEDIGEDARRRDFTMNALYAEPDGTLVDPLGGLDDLRAGKVRFIEDATARITEDYLRILRFFRFHAWYGDPDGGLDPEGLAACAALAEGLQALSKERIGAEMLKLLAAPDPAPAMAAMVATGCLLRVLPGADPKALPVLVHLEAQLGTPPKALRRLAALGGDNVTDNLRLSRSESRDLGTIRQAALGDAKAAELAYRHGAEMARDATLVRAAFLESPTPVSLELDLAKGKDAVFPVAGNDLAGRYGGPELGRKLRELESIWIASDFAATRADLLKHS